MDNKIIKITLTLLLLISLLDNPYWFYQLVRIFGTIGFCLLAFSDYKNQIKYTPIIFCIAAILLNPIIKISFDRETWQILDILFAIIVSISLIFEKRINNYLKNA